MGEASHRWSLCLFRVKAWSRFCAPVAGISGKIEERGLAAKPPSRPSPSGNWLAELDHQGAATYISSAHLFQPLAEPVLHPSVPPSRLLLSHFHQTSLFYCCGRRGITGRGAASASDAILPRVFTSPRTLLLHTTQRTRTAAPQHGRVTYTLSAPAVLSRLVSCVTLWLFWLFCVQGRPASGTDWPLSWAWLPRPEQPSLGGDQPSIPSRPQQPSCPRFAAIPAGRFAGSRRAGRHPAICRQSSRG